MKMHNVMPFYISWCKRSLWAFVLCFTLWSCETGNSKVNTDEATLSECAPLPHALAAATAFSCNGKGYIFGGRDEQGVYQNNLFEYDPQTDTWTDLGATPLQARVNAAACAVGDSVVYLGLGYQKGAIYTDSAYLNDFWRYRPADQTFERLPDYPCHETDKCVLFYQNGRLYSGLGYQSAHSSRMFVYQIDTQAWSEQSFSSLGRPVAAFATVGATCGDRYFAGTGFTLKSVNQWYEYHPSQARFVRLTPMPDKGRDSAAATANATAVYVFGGQRFGGDLTALHFYTDIMRYSPTANAWSYAGKMPCGGAIAMSCLAIGQTVYFGLGETRNGTLLNQWYKLEEK